ncbi:hypothetical protein IE81DRAFT_326865 [Ceraceosorus guamensis]|uniref:Uncharacterized protein n=1 Tax=Ceraceosorus guamensis TaxID=1522189 RepID=A0A316VP75_9BASI|nr:hypothetical protein IE81DRAFT_326865 [Ceraceosorus guamensis]PWN39114.1 hypothetical protein IE81DRAFT_326865 [Ceraceosorus guamensis]
MPAEEVPHLPPELQTLISELAAETDVSSALALSSTSKMLSTSAVKSLFSHPFLHTLGQVKSFTAALRRSPELKPLVKSLAIEDRYLHLSTSIADYPDSHDFDKPDEREPATFELCELIEDLVTSHNLRALALTVTGARNFIDIFEQPSPAKQPFTQRLALDKLALTGTDIQSSFLFKWFHSRQLILYTCDDAMWGMGTFNNVRFSTCPNDSDSHPGQTVSAPLELIYCVGNVSGHVGEEAAVQALLPLHKALLGRHTNNKVDPRFERVVLRMRRSLASEAQVQAIVEKGRNLLDAPIEAAGWDTKQAKTQIEAEQLDLTSGAWLHIGEAKDLEKDVEQLGDLKNWSDDDGSRITEYDAEDYDEGASLADEQTDALRDALLS